MAEDTYEEWQEKCSEIVKARLGRDDLLDDSDPYDLHAEMEYAYDESMTPEEFVDEFFAEELDEHTDEEEEEDEEEDWGEDDKDEEDEEEEDEEDSDDA